MRQLRRLSVGVLLLVGAVASADSNDLVLGQLGSPIPGGMNYSPAADGNFRAFAAELGSGLSSYTLTGTHTLGYNGFALEPELAVVSFGDSVQFPTEKPFSSPLLLPSLHVRKGLPWSLELGGRMAWVDKSHMAAGTLEGRWAITEGFRALPEVTLRVYGTHLFGAENFRLWGAGTDLSVGKRFAVGGMITLAPYAGWNLGWTHATSQMIDFNPGRTEAEAEATPTAQLVDTAAYTSVAASNNFHNRFYLGGRFVGGAFTLGAELSYTTLGAIDAPDPAVPGSTTRGLPSIVTFSTAIGFDF